MQDLLVCSCNNNPLSCRWCWVFNLQAKVGITCDVYCNYVYISVLEFTITNHNSYCIFSHFKVTTASEKTVFSWESPVGCVCQKSKIICSSILNDSQRCHHLEFYTSKCILQSNLMWESVHLDNWRQARMDQGYVRLWSAYPGEAQPGNLVLQFQVKAEQNQLTSMSINASITDCQHCSELNAMRKRVVHLVNHYS